MISDYLKAFGKILNLNKWAERIAFVKRLLATDDNTLMLQLKELIGSYQREASADLQNHVKVAIDRG